MFLCCVYPCSQFLSPVWQTGRGPQDSTSKGKGSKQHPQWHPGQLHRVMGGGAEAQSLLDRLEANMGIAVVIWFAHWAETCRASLPTLEK